MHVFSDVHAGASRIEVLAGELQPFARSVRPQGHLWEF